MQKKRLEPLNTNVLVPFTGEVADKIKEIAEANGMPVTTVTRVLLLKALELVESGAPLSLKTVAK